MRQLDFSMIWNSRGERIVAPGQVPPNQARKPVSKLTDTTERIGGFRFKFKLVSVQKFAGESSCTYGRQISFLLLFRDSYQ